MSFQVNRWRKEIGDTMNILQSNKLYIFEKGLHDRHCDGFGYIHYINKFTLHETTEECEYCKKLLAVKEKKTHAFLSNTERDALNES